MVEAIRAVREETKSEVDMRVGIHTGSVLAGTTITHDLLGGLSCTSMFCGFRCICVSIKHDLMIRCELQIAHVVVNKDHISGLCQMTLENIVKLKKE